MSSVPTVSLAPRVRRRSLWSRESLDDVEATMLDLCSGDRLDRLGAILQEHLGAGGKRLRARLALGALEALGGERSRGIAWAAACELLHNATLLHDDLQDGDRLRRGREAAWVRHGAAQAINAGDLCLMLPYRALERVPGDGDLRWRLASVLARGAEEVARGQARELELLSRGNLDWDDWHDAASGKTAALFGLPVHGAALLAGLDDGEAARIADVFATLGVLFQLQDDVLDLWGDKGRDRPGSDLEAGRVSAVVVEHLRLHPEDRGWLVELLRRPRGETPPAAVRQAITRFEEGGALTAVWERLHALEDAIDAAPVFASRSRLHALAVALSAQALAPIVHTDPRFGRQG